MNTNSHDSPSAKAAQRIQHYLGKSRVTPSGLIEIERVVQQSLSDSLRPYRELAEKWREEAAVCDTANVSFVTKREQGFIANRARDCADELEALIKEAGK